MSKTNRIPVSGYVQPGFIRFGSARSECIRCGICCRKGGPSFHISDKELIEKGIILSKYLFTIREGEPAYDNIKGGVFAADSDIIKLKGIKKSWTCIFFDENKKLCEIYQDRPIECRALKCWDTFEIERLYSKNRLTRKDLVLKVEGLWDLIEDHQTRCDYHKIKGFVKAIDGENKKNAIENILDLVKYDLNLRSVVVEKGGLDPDILDFLFGRSLLKTIKLFGLKIVKKNDCLSILPEID